MGLCQDTRRNFKENLPAKYTNSMIANHGSFSHRIIITVFKKSGLRIWIRLTYAVLFGRLRIWTFLAFDPDPQTGALLNAGSGPEPDPETCKFDHFKTKI
jgi:hypothetical protein